MRAFTCSAVGLAMSAAAALACPANPTTVTIPFGGTQHITPTDQGCAQIANLTQVSVQTLSSTIATWARDATGIQLTAVAPGSWPALLQWSDGVNPVVKTANFTVVVLPPPPAVTTLNYTSP